MGHVLAHRSPGDTAWDMVTNQLRHDLAAYKTLPVNRFEKVAIINAVLVPRCTCRGLGLGNRQHMAQWDDIVLQFLRKMSGVEPRMNVHHTTTDLQDGGMRPC